MNALAPINRASVLAWLNHHKRNREAGQSDMTIATYLFISFDKRLRYCSSSCTGSSSSGLYESDDAQSDAVSSSATVVRDDLRFLRFLPVGEQLSGNLPADLVHLVDGRDEVENE